MHGYNGLGPGRDFLFEIGRVQVEGVVNLRRNRHSPCLDDGLIRGHKGEPLGDDFVTGRNAKGSQGDFQSSGARSDSVSVHRSRVLGEFLFKFSYLIDSLPLVVEFVPEEDSRFQYLIDLFLFRFAHPLKSGHKSLHNHESVVSLQVLRHLLGTVSPTTGA